MNKNSVKKSMILYLCIVLAMAQINNVFAYEQDQDLDAYSNKIIDIKEIKGAQNCTIILMFEHENPIITYAPLSYDECKDDTFNRFFMPNTIVSDDVSIDFGALSQKKSGVELMLAGALVKKIVVGNKISITISVSSIN